METVVTLLVLVAILSAVVEALCEFVFQILKNVGVPPDKWTAWKPVAVMILTIAGTTLLNISLLTAYFPTLVLPYTWLDPLFTGILLGGGADLIHLLKDLSNPPVKA